MKKTLRRSIQIGSTLLLLGWWMTAIGGEFSVATLMEQFGKRHSGNAVFVERKYLSALDRPIEQSGTLAFSPGRLEKVTYSPHPERMVVEGSMLTIEAGVDKRMRRLKLKRYPAIQGIIEGLRATLTGDLATLRRFYDVSLDGTPGQWQLIMKPRQSNMAAAVREIRVGGADSSIDVIEIQHQGGDRSVMRISEAAS